MPVTSQSPVISYTSNGSVTSFAYPFRIISANDLYVYVNGVQVSTGFSITNIGNSSGGNVVFTVAPAAGTVRLQRRISIQRSTDYVEGGQLAASTLDNDFDQIVMMVQDVNDQGLIEAPDGLYDAKNKRIKNVADPVNAQDVVTKAYHDSNYLPQMTSLLSSTQTASTAASTSASAAATSATSASTSASTAVTQATTATTKAGEAATSATNAASSASAASTSATSASTSATTATTQASNASGSAAAASTSANAASTSASAASASASAASSSASAAATSATSAGTSATNAANSASAASGSASTATTKATEATSSAATATTQATNAAASATSASTSATTATTQATTATTKASEASTSATNAATSATSASTSATNAANSASSISGSVTAAATSATNAAASATSAATSATTATTQATNAAASAAAASASASAAASPWMVNAGDAYYTAGDVGIGLSAPLAALHVSKASAGATTELLRLSNSGSGANTKSKITFTAAGSDYASMSGGYGALSPEVTFDINGASHGNFIWNSAGVERMRIDSAGNAGLGVTPSAWRSNGTAIDLSGGGSIYGSTGVNTSHMSVNANSYMNSSFGFIYKATAAATRYQQIAGAHQWYNAPSGTAGTAITFTQAMTLDTNGNLGLGRIPSTWASNHKAFELGTTGANYSSLSQQTDNSSALALSWNAYGTTGDNVWNYRRTGDSACQLQLNSNWLNFRTAPVGTADTAVSWTSQFQINPSGNIGIGRTPIVKMDIQAAGPSQVRVRGGTGTGEGGAFYVTQGGSDSTLLAIGDLANMTGTAVNTNAAIWTASGIPLKFYVGAADRGGIDAAGNLAIVGNNQIGAGKYIHNGSFGRLWMQPGAQIGTASYAGLYGAALTYNVKHNGTVYQSIGGGTASALTLDEGIFSFSNSNSVGAPDATLTWNTRFTIDGNGYAGIGAIPSGTYQFETSSALQGVANFVTSNANGGYLALGRSGAQGLIGSYKAASGGGTTIGADALFLRSANGIAFGSGGAAVSAHLDTSGNLGLGVVPKTTWWGNAKAIETSNGALFNWSSNYTALASGAYFDSATANRYKNTGIAASLYLQGNGNHNFYNAPAGTADAAFGWTPVMSLDSNGNLGLGVTPSSWGTLKAIEMGAGTFLANNGGSAQYLGTNLYWNGTNWISKTSTGSTMYTQNAAGVGFHQWTTAATGTAGTTASLLTRMTLDSAGNLAIGGNVPTGWVGASGANGGAIQGDSWTIGSGAGNDQTDYITGAYRDAYASTYKARYTGGVSVYTQTQGKHTWGSGTGTGGANVAIPTTMTLSAAGQLGIGTVTPGAMLDVLAPSSGDTTIRLSKTGSINATVNAVSGALTFGIDGAGGGTERLRIGSSGQLGIAGANYGTSGQALVSNGAAAAPSWQTIANGVTTLTPVTASGASVTFSGIPASAKKIIINIRGLTISGASSEFGIRLGTSGGIQSTAYRSSSVESIYNGSGSFNTGMTLGYYGAAATTSDAQYEIDLINSTSHIWQGTGVHANYDASDIVGSMSTCHGRKTLSAALTQLSIYSNGSTFTGGEITVSYI